MQLLPILLSTFASLCLTQAMPQSSKLLLSAVKNNDPAEVHRLLDNGADPNSYDEDSDYVLMNAALYSSVDLMQLLLEKGSNVNATNKLGETALMWAADDLEKLKVLLKHGADINVKAKSGNSVLLTACVGYSKYGIVKFLIDNGADVFALNDRKENALMRAALFGDTSTISLLLDKGIDVDAINQDSTTAMMNSIFNVNRQVTIQLLQRGADPDLVGSFGLTAVSASVTYNDTESVLAILRKAKNINTTDYFGNSALMWAVYNEHDNTTIIQALLDKGADVNIKAKDGSTALSWALKKGNTATVTLLRKAGAE